MGFGWRNESCWFEEGDIQCLRVAILTGFKEPPPKKPIISRNLDL